MHQILIFKNEARDSNPRGFSPFASIILIVKEMDRHLLIAPSIKIALLKRLTICKAFLPLLQTKLTGFLCLQND